MEHKPSTHPDLGEIEALRRGEADAAIADHVADCALCRANLDELVELAKLIRDADVPPPALRPDVEARILWNARKHFARMRRRRMLTSMRTWAIAATLLISVGAMVVWRQAGRTPTGPDAVDALLAARAMGPDAAANRRFDFNGDGMVDERDVDGTLRQVVSLVVAPAQALPLPTEAGAEVRFRQIDIFVDAGSDALAAYQVEITTTGDAKCVGIGGGEPPAFVAPPYYDPAAAYRSGRLILAAITTDRDLPRGRTRVAFLSMREVGAVTYKIRLMAAARADGSRFAPGVSAAAGGEP